MDTIPASDPMQNPPYAPLGGLDPAELLKQGAAEDTFMAGATIAFNPPLLEELAAVFPQFEILELIGKGGMGAVYKVRQKDLDRIVALKILPPAIGQSPEFSNRFTREAKALAKLNHPGIVTLHEFGQADGLYFILMEFVDGVNLGQLMKTGRISPREALAIVPQICDALQFAHDQGIVHRDIKPENILLDRLGHVKVADFGIAKVVASVCDRPAEEEGNQRRSQTDATLAGKIIGTPQYMAPEQIDHPSEVDHRADIYALGVVFYQMLTGELPGKRLEAPSKKVHIDVRLDEIVLKAMEKNPELRYQQASVLRTRVDTIASGDKTSESGDIPLRAKVIRWAIHLVWAACTSGLVALAIMFVSETLTKDRGNLDQSRMTHEDYYGPVITVLLGCGLLAVPIKAFRFASARVWIGAVFTTAGITAITYVLAAPVEDRAFNSTNFIIAVALCALGTFLFGFAAVFGKEKPQVSQHAENQLPPISKQTSPGKIPSSPRWRKTKWIVAACLAVGVLWFALRPPGRSYPGSSTSSAFKAPVMGRIEFRYRHPDSTGGGAIGYPVKRWGDTQWKPSLDQTIGLKGGRKLSFKTRVDAMRSDAPVAMVTTSLDNSEWETKALRIDGEDTLRQLVFSNGLRMEIHWTPADSSMDKPYPIDPIQQQVMLSASRESDRMHPLKVDDATLIAAPALRFVGLQYPSQERWHPDGSLVTDPHELALIREIGPIYAGDMSKGESIRGMEFWFSHPQLESWHVTEIEFLDESGIVAARLGGLNGKNKETYGSEGRLYWSLKTTPVDISKPLNVRLNYTMGPLEHIQEHIVEPNASGSFFSDGNTRVASVGQTAGGRAFLALAVDEATQSKHRFGVEAVTKDGAIIKEVSWWGGGGPGRPDIITFEFGVPISEVAKFRIGTRPLRSFVWKNVAVSAKNADVIGDGSTAQKAPVGALAEAWLAGVDAGDYARSWNEAAEFFQKSITAEAWGEDLTKFRKSLGAVKTRKIREMKEAKTLPGAPDGKYWIMQFDTSFAAKAEAVETVTFMLEKDGAWKVTGYFIR